jgi:hypothetical protein
MKIHRSPHRSSGRRGSVLVTALVFAAVIAISLTSYLRLASNSNKLSYRSHYAGVAMNAAETGLELAMWSINKTRAGSDDAWNNWDTTGGSTARRTFPLGDVSGGGSVSVKVLVSDRNLASPSPYAVARAIVTPVDGAPIEKWIKISLRQRNRFSNGLVSKNSITFSGNNAYVDSYDSALGPYDASTNRNAKGSAGSASVAVDSLSVGNADIFGYVSIGTANYDGLKVGSQGKVTGDFNASGGTVDYTRVATNFTANFEDVSAPAVAATDLGTVSSDLTLPADPVNDVKLTAADGTVTYYYSAAEISLNGDALTISPGYNVVLVVTGDIDIGGNQGTIDVSGTQDPDTGDLVESSLNLYVTGDVSIAGKGMINSVTSTTTSEQTVVQRIRGVLTSVVETVTTTSTSAGRPKNLMLWGTGDDSQTIKVSGNGSLSAVVYAPNATIEAKGGGNSGAIYGSFIGDTITITGNDGFHYDESLKDLDSGEPLGIEKWDEFVAQADRAALGALMDF